jgi:hypothetical protein
LNVPDHCFVNLLSPASGLLRRLDELNAAAEETIALLKRLRSAPIEAARLGQIAVEVAK